MMEDTVAPRHTEDGDGRPSRAMLASRINPAIRFDQSEMFPPEAMRPVCDGPTPEELKRWLS